MAISSTRTGEIDVNLTELKIIGKTTLNSVELIQTLGGTDVTAKWALAGSPALTTGMYYFTFTAGASTFRVPCFPTT